MAELIIRIRVWLGSYPAHKIHQIFITITTTTTTSSTTTTIAIEFSLCGSSPYTSTDKTNKNKYT